MAEGEAPSPYSGIFQGQDAVARYRQKLANRIEVLRDRREVDILARWVSGEVFDCTIGVGRFIGRLRRVTRYSGMDLSAEFVAHVTAQHPEVAAQQADLTKGIPHPDHAFDAVLCLRSLSAIGSLAAILAEMVRVARPSGVVVFDYGRVSKRWAKRGRGIVVDGEDLEGALAGLDADVVARIPVDALTTRLKASPRAARFLLGPRGRWIPDPFIMAGERALAPLFWQRQVIVLRKRRRSA